MPMPRAIVVSSNCQTAGIALALRALLPSCAVTAMPASAIGAPDTLAQLESALLGADYWVTSASRARQALVSSQAEIITVPEINFKAFHPDLTVVFDGEKRLRKGAGHSDYHSYIAYWCRRHGLPEQTACSLFRPDVFQAMGYMSLWPAEFARLKFIVEAHGMDFGAFMAPLMRPEPFMHSSNHPKMQPLMQIARQAAVRMGVDRASLAAPFERSLPDTLASASIWPVYPGVAEAYGMKGAFFWKIGADTLFHSVEAYVQAAYRSYGDADMSGWTSISDEHVDFDQALRRITGVS